MSVKNSLNQNHPYEVRILLLPIDLIENKSETIKKYLLKAGAKSSLELLGSEEKLREFKDEMRDKNEMQEKIRKERKKQLKENYRAIVEKTPLVFHRDIEVIKA